MKIGYGLCVLFAPGDRHILVGTRAGELQLLHTGSGAVLENIQAHSGAVWSIAMHPSRRGFVTGSADHDVKFWDFDLVRDADAGPGAGRRLSCLHVRTLKMSDDVMAVCYSPDERCVPELLWVVWD